MKKIVNNYPKKLIKGKRELNARRFLNILLAAVITGSILITDTGCKTHKAATSTNTDDAKAKAEAAARKKAEEEAAAKAAADAAAKREPYNRVEKYFQQISDAPDVNTANQTINSAMSSFKTGDIPVLIIIYRNGISVDYDQPTTISKYLNYLKDQKKNPNAVDHLEMDGNGKITEVVLIKK